MHARTHARAPVFHRWFPRHPRQRYARSGCTPCVACASGRSIERPPRRHVRITAVVQPTDRSVDHTTVRGSSSRRRRRAVTATEKARCEKKQPSRRAAGLAGARARTHASWTRALSKSAETDVCRRRAPRIPYSWSFRCSLLCAQPKKKRCSTKITCHLPTEK